MATRDIQIEFPSMGTTYCREVYGVYAYDTWPSSSVLAGQCRRTFLGSFTTLEQATAKYPNATVTNGSGFSPYR